MTSFLSRNEKKILLLIVFLALAVSLAYSFYFKIVLSVDARAYDRIAVNLIKGYGYVENASVPFENDFAIVRVGPGYELFLAAVYYAFGRHLEIVWILQAIFHALSVLLVFLISKKIFRSLEQSIIGLAASLLFAFSPDLIISSSMLLTETLTIFLTLVSVYFFFEHFEFYEFSSSRGRGWPPFFLSGFFAGLAVLTRSNLALLTVAYLMIFVWRRLYLRAIFFTLIIFLLFLPWVLRNYEAYGIFLPFNAASGFNLWTGNHLGASGELDFFEPLDEFSNSHISIETYRFGTSQFKEFVFGHPLEFIKITLKRVSIYFSFLRPTGFWSYLSNVQKMITIGLSFVYGVAIFSLGFSGLYFGLKHAAERNGARVRQFALMSLTMPLAVVFIIVETRYRYPLYPFFATFAGLAVYKFMGNKKLFSKVFILIFLALSANALIDFSINSDKFFEIINLLR